jgi:lipid II:glycine glycyltransferase (peptidoglycan interpeptide bridge formation enzyme)
LLLAEYKQKLLAALMTFRHGNDAYYFYGASSSSHRNLMPAYLLQWEAIQWAKGYHCKSYDLWGIPDAPPSRLEAEFTQRTDGLWGVYRFKRGFGGQIIRSIGAFDYVYNPQLYKVYRFYRRL